MTEYILRFLIGGLFVSILSMIGDVVRPKTFAGLFGAAPSVAFATLGIAWFQHGVEYVQTQATSMMLGAVALICYSALVCQLLMRLNLNAITATISSIAVWVAVAIGLHQLMIG